MATTISSRWTDAIRLSQTVYAFLKIVLYRVGLLSSKYLPWYTAEPPASYLTPTVHRWLAQYIKLEEDQVLPHLVDIHDRAWAVYPYPCIGQYAFLHSQLKLLPEYPTILSKLREPDAIFLDVGVCLGQDLRYLIAEGIPSRNLYGLDVTPDFWELGFELFKDRDTLDSKFLHADLLSPDSIDLLSLLYGRCDVIQLTSFFHLFDLPAQKRAIRQLVQLSRKGTIVAGLHVGQAQPGPIQMSGGLRFLHDPESWRKLWNEFTKSTGTTWQIHASWREWKGQEKDRYAWMGSGRRRIKWFAQRTS